MISARLRRLFLPLLFFHCSLTVSNKVSNSFCCFFLHSCPSLSKSLLTQFSHLNIDIPRMLFLYTFCAHILLTNFFLKLSFSPTFILNSPILLLSAFLTAMILLTRLFSLICPFPVVSLLIYAIVSMPYSTCMLYYSTGSTRPEHLF